MLRLLALSLLLSPMLLRAQGENLADSPKELSKLIVQSIRDYDLSFYQSLIASTQDCKDINTQSGRPSALGNDLQRFADSASYYSKNAFSAVLNALVSDGFELQQTSITEIVYHQWHSESIDWMSIRIFLRYQEREAELYLPRCSFASSWVLFENLQVIPSSE